MRNGVGISHRALAGRAPSPCKRLVGANEAENNSVYHFSSRKNGRDKKGKVHLQRRAPWFSRIFVTVMDRLRCSLLLVGIGRSGLGGKTITRFIAICLLSLTALCLRLHRLSAHAPPRWKRVVQCDRFAISCSSFQRRELAGNFGRMISMPENTIDQMKQTPKVSNYYKRKRADPINDDKCSAMHEWQLRSFPTCNPIHEIDQLAQVRVRNASIVNSGHYRDVWKVEDEIDGSKWAMKVFRYRHEFTERNFDRHRRDHLAYERLSFSENVLKMYSFCANTGVFDYSEGGDIEKLLFYEDGDTDDNNRANGLSKLDRLRVAQQVAAGLADLHGTEKDGQPAIAHTDIRLDQFILIDGKYKLNDFNRARFMRKNKKTGKSCGFRVGKNLGKFRAPEEYRYDEETEKVDVYSMGNIFYVLLTGYMPFDDESTEEAQEKVEGGSRPKVPRRIRKSDDPIHIVLMKAMKMCYVHDPSERASAREVSDLLTSELANIEDSAT